MDLLKIGLIAYILYIPIFFVLLNLTRLKYKNYPASKKIMVSSLGEKKSPMHQVFNISISLFGFLSLFFVTSLKNLFPNFFISKIGLFFLYLNCFSCILLGFFPSDKRTKFHILLGSLLILGILGSSLLLIYPIYISSHIPNLFIALNLIVFISTIFFVGSILKKRLLWEWLMLLSAASWDFVMAVVSLVGFR